MAEARGSGRQLDPDDLLRRGIDDLPDHAFFTLDPQGSVASWNAGAERLLGWTRDRAVHAHVSSTLGPGGPEPGIGTDDLDAVVRLGPQTRIRRLTHRDGSTRAARTTIVPVRDEAQLIGYTVVAQAEAVAVPPIRHRAAQHDRATDETKRQLSESRALLAAEIEDRRQAESARSRLLRRLVVAQEDERRRLARELHDGLGQRLTALRLVLEAHRGSSGAAAEPDAITSALEMLGRIDEDVDFIAWELRPAALDELGLARVLDTYVKEWSRHAGIPAAFHVRPGNLQRFAPEVEASIYRIAQEALNNVVKHARARSVNVLLELRGDTLTLVVEDDGVGLHATLQAETMIGLTGMRERALAVGGTVEIEPTPGGGATLLASIPTAAAPLDRLRLAGESGAPQGADAAVLAPESIEVSGAVASAIRARLQELQQAVGARDEFIATVAHELRNPIAPLTFQVRLALDKTERLAASGTPISIEWLQAQLRGVEQRLHRLLETLDRLLDVSRLSTGRIDLQPEPMDLSEIVREVIEGFDAELAVARCRLTLSTRGTTTGSWDRLRVEQVIRNLLSNAIRFGAGRPIEVTVDADPEFVRVAVRDHGIGIAPEQQARIFERFERGAGQRSGGFGIGLWIVRNICVAMGGTVSVDSAVGEGACFTVILPRRPARLALESSRSDAR